MADKEGNNFFGSKKTYSSTKTTSETLILPIKIPKNASHTTVAIYYRTLVWQSALAVVMVLVNPMNVNKRANVFLV